MSHQPKRRELLLGGLAWSLCLPFPALAQGQGLTLPLPKLTARHAFIGNLNETLLAIDADKAVPIASVSKLITAFVILSADLPMDEKVRITDVDVKRTLGTKSSLAVGSVWRREQLLEWLLVASDNRAAAALARSYPGDWPEFQIAMRMLITQMQLFSFDFGDSSGLSGFNQANARDLGVLLVLLSQNAWFQRLARKPNVGAKMNVNRYARDRSVALLAGKTGFTSAAGYCLAQAEQFGDQVFALVVLHAKDRESRARDMDALRRYAKQKLGLSS